MKSSGDEAASSKDLEHRRWLIGIGISVLFGIFGVVMALLNYSGRSKPTAPQAPQAPAAVAPERAGPPGRGHGKGHDRE
jgi:hypothetical protein